MAKAFLFCSCLALAVVGCHGDTPPLAPPPATSASAPPVSAVPLDPHAPLRVSLLGSPERSARAWTSALVPNSRGGWNFITQSWENGSPDLPEWVIVDLDAGTPKIVDAAHPGYAVNTFQVRRQVRAQNGRVFFPLSGMGLAYYDPTDETVKDVPPLLPPEGPDKIIYDAKLGPDGMIYAGTQSNELPTILQIDPNTLNTRVLGHVGRDRKTYSYAYQIAVDPPWVYATVGELPWELAALDIKTGEMRILETRADRGWMVLETHPEGVRAQLVTGVHTQQAINDYVWCIDGKTMPVADSHSKAPFAARKVLPPTPLPGAPELDDTAINPDFDGIGRIRWRPPGTSDWRTVEYHVKHTTPIAIEALTALPDGTVFGETKQYHGFFKTDGSSLARFAGPSPSQSVFAVLDGVLYTTGYPNAVLYAYDFTKPWNGTTPEAAQAPNANPKLQGNFTQSGAKYSSFLTPSQHRLYFAGRRERDGLGGGVGYYEPATKRFVGHHDNLNDVIPAGLVALPELGRVVMSARVRKGGDADHAELIVYDNELVEQERLVVKPDLPDTGLIYASGDSDVIVGVVHDAVYRYDVAAKKLLAWRDLPGKGEAGAQRPSDGSLWVVIGTTLLRIDPHTLETETFGTEGVLPPGIEHLVWDGNDLYATVGADLFRIERVGLP